MPMYEYACPKCGNISYSTTRTSRLEERCRLCDHTPQHRRFGFSLKPMMHEHFNKTVGMPISDMSQFKSELSRKSDEATMRTGIEHNYQPIDMQDRDGLGVTGEGIDESNRVREKRGMPLLPDIT